MRYALSNYPCKYCAKQFTQAPNREAHEHTHTGTFLVCNLCEWSTYQDPEMTRHKQVKHGHPARGEPGVRVSHSVKMVATNSKAGVQRGHWYHGRFVPYVRPYARAAAPAYDTSMTFEEIPANPVRLRVSPSPTSPVISSPAFSQNRGQRTFFESPQQTNGSQASSSYLDLDRSSFRLDLQFAENQSNNFEGFQVDSIPLGSFTAPSMPECTSPMTHSSSAPSPCSDTDLCPLSPEQWADSMLQPPKLEEVDQGL
ncbi:hypothetical protein FIBSPDRAFT_1041696 [Athelia psychrophila]|uniref:C2H2-type domain-containing protein n=1 Tax=Athelia psychrophila TaxID=1759441 RepID=A0A166NP46_9AGAM|nr:hypothetical protein FIBSPDRAFT_1041696 [Fibularhizoctonia sp. CBS 109695]